MPKIINPLTETEVRTAQAGKKTKYLFDGAGLFLEIATTGSKLWRLRYYFEGKQKLISMGAYPEVGLKDARIRRDNARKLISEGVDPGEHKKALTRAKAERANNSFEAIAREWFLKFKHTWVPSHEKVILRRFEKDLFPWLGGRPIAEIDAPELLKVIRQIEARGALESAHRAVISCGQVFRYAVVTGRASRDPSQDIRGALPPSVIEHFSAITDPEKFGEFLRCIDKYRGGMVVRAALRLAPMLVVRSLELRMMEWSCVNLDAAEWRFLVTKTKVLHLVPLPKQALVILEELKPLTGNGKYVFAKASSDGSEAMSKNSVLMALRSVGYGTREITQHGLRASFRTMGAENLGFRSDLMEHQLAHAVRDPNGRAYNRTEFLKERREMMQRWADYLESLKNNFELPAIAAEVNDGSQANQI